MFILVIQFMHQQQAWVALLEHCSATFELLLAVPQGTKNYILFRCRTNNINVEPIALSTTLTGPILVSHLI